MGEMLGHVNESLLMTLLQSLMADVSSCVQSFNRYWAFLRMPSVCTCGQKNTLSRDPNQNPHFANIALISLYELIMKCWVLTCNATWSQIKKKTTVIVSPNSVDICVSKKFTVWISNIQLTCEGPKYLTIDLSDLQYRPVLVCANPPDLLYMSALSLFGLLHLTPSFAAIIITSFAKCIAEQETKIWEVISCFHSWPIGLLSWWSWVGQDTLGVRAMCSQSLTHDSVLSVGGWAMADHIFT